ncbi:MAG: hypothetical protein AAF802_02965, partial [Planctomycetota bacterium]
MHLLIARKEKWSIDANERCCGIAVGQSSTKSQGTQKAACQGDAAGTVPAPDQPPYELIIEGNGID